MSQADRIAPSPDAMHIRAIPVFWERHALWRNKEILRHLHPGGFTTRQASFRYPERPANRGSTHFPMHQSFSLVRMKRWPSLTAMLLRVVSPALPIGMLARTFPSARFCTTAVPRSPRL